MSLLLRSAVVVTTSLAAGVLVAPVAAHAADTTTQLSATAMTTALKKVSTTSTTAAKNGWRVALSTSNGEQSLSGSYVVDPKGGIVATRIMIGKQLVATYAVEGKGLYLYLADPAARSAVEMMGRPSVRYAFTSKASMPDTPAADDAPSPAAVLAEGADRAGTRTSHDDGSADYGFTAGKGEKVALRVNRSGVLTSVRSVSKEGRLALAYRYGAQRVTLPSASATVDWATLERAMAYLKMPAIVKAVADQGAAHTRQAADGKTVKVAMLRKIVRRDVTAVNKSGEVRIKAGNVDGGARVSATNPWTHKKASYTVTVSGRTVLVKKG